MTTKNVHMHGQWIVVGQSPFQDTAVAVGPFVSSRTALTAGKALRDKGWNAELIQLAKVSDIPNVTSDEEGE